LSISIVGFMKKLPFVVVSISWYLVFGSSCKPKPHAKLIVYQGPILAMDSIHTLYSDSAKLKVQIQAPQQLEFENGDRTFPKGIDIDFYDEKGRISSHLKSNQAKYDKKTGRYTAIGNVRIVSLEKQEKLNTELLNWDPNTQKVFTDQFVRIETKEEILTGNGLEADQGFKKYKILKPAGVFAVQ
jgi:LPS export ABC transporter protein LptC